MAWKTLRDALEMAAACGFDVDCEGSVAAEPRRPKRAASKVPAAKSFREDTPPAVIHRANREMVIAPPNGLPRPAVIISLVVDNEGGRTTQGRRLDRPTYRDGSWRERARETGIRLVAG